MEIGIREAVFSALRDRRAKVTLDLLPPADQHRAVVDAVFLREALDVELLRLEHLEIFREMLLDPDRRRRTASEIRYVAEHKKHVPRFAGADRRLAFIAYVPAVAGVAQEIPLQRQRDQYDDHKKDEHPDLNDVRFRWERRSRSAFQQTALRLRRCRRRSGNADDAQARTAQALSRRPA